MNQSDIRVPYRFDDSDIMLPEFWKDIFDTDTHIPYCVGNDDTEALFFLRTSRGDNAMRAKIVSRYWNRVTVTSLNKYDVLNNECIGLIKELFLNNNSCQVSEFNTCRAWRYTDKNIHELTFSYYHEYTT